MGRYLLFLVPQMLSLLGSSALQFGIIWTLTMRYSSGMLLFVSSVLGFVPQFLLMLFSGSLADRNSRKRLIIASDSISALMALILLLSIRAGYDGTGLFLLLLSVRSACSGLQGPAAESALPLMVGKERVERANGIRSVFTSTVSFLSPAAAGVMLTAAGLESLLLLDIVTAAAAAAAVLPMDIPESGMREGTGITGGLRYAAGNDALRRILIFHGVSIFIISPGAMLTPLLVSRSFASAPSALALSEASYSLGMIAGGAFVSLLPSEGKRMKRAGAALAVYGLMLIGMGFSGSFLLYLVMNFIIGSVSPLYSSLVFSEVQILTDDGMMGRVTSLLSALTSAAIPLGLALSGPLSDAAAVRPVFAASGAMAVLCGTLGRVLITGRK